MLNGIQIRDTDKQQCEACPNTGNNMKLFGTIVMCPTCLEKEQLLQKESKAKELERIAETRKPLNSHAEYFNAQTQSIIERRRVIESNPEIKDKNWTEANELLVWLKESQTNLFNLRKREQEEIDTQNAIQVRLNTLANQLRAEQREQLKLKDLNYKPIEVKKPTAPKVTKPAKFDRVALATASKMYNIPEAVLQVICVQKKVDVDTAVKIFLNAKDATGN